MFRVARRAARLSDGLVNDGDDCVVGDASFPWTVVIHDVAETQRALLHSVLPTGLHCRFALKCADPTYSGAKVCSGALVPRNIATRKRQEVRSCRSPEDNNKRRAFAT